MRSSMTHIIKEPSSYHDGLKCSSEASPGRTSRVAAQPGRQLRRPGPHWVTRAVECILIWIGVLLRWGSKPRRLLTLSTWFSRWPLPPKIFPRCETQIVIGTGSIPPELGAAETRLDALCVALCYPSLLSPVSTPPSWRSLDLTQIWSSRE